jgi:hypothetical protein
MMQSSRNMSFLLRLKRTIISAPMIIAIVLLIAIGIGCMLVLWFAGKSLSGGASQAVGRAEAVDVIAISR